MLKQQFVQENEDKGGEMATKNVELQQFNASTH